MFWGAWEWGLWGRWDPGLRQKLEAWEAIFLEASIAPCPQYAPLV